MNGLDYKYPPEGDAMHSDYEEKQGYGAPTYQQPPPAQPQYAGAPYPPPGPLPPRRAAPEKKWMILGVIGIILVIVGMSIAAIGQTAPPPNKWNYYDESHHFDSVRYGKDYAAWVNNTESSVFFGKLIGVGGDAMIGLMALGLMIDNNIEDEKRKYLLLASFVLFGLVTIAVMTMGGMVGHPLFYQR